MKKGRDILLLLMSCTGIVYSNHFDNAFHFDDSHTIVNNLSIRDVNIPSFFTDGTTFSSLPANQSYRPVVTTLNAIDYNLGGGSTLWFHISIFASFLLAGCLLFFFTEHLLRKSGASAYATEISLFITAWFWLHPANAETINYIIARSDSFSTCMVLLSFVLYSCWPFTRKNFLYLLPFVLAFLAKETAIMLLPLLFLYEIMFGEASVKSAPGSRLATALKKIVPCLLTAIGLLLMYKQMLPSSWEAGGAYNKTGYWLTQPFALLHYVGNFLIPANLVVDTDWELVNSVSDQRFYIGMSFLLIIVVLACICCIRPRFRVIGFGLSWFLLASLPTSVVPLAEVINDHRTFFPYIGLFIALAGLLQLLAIRFTQRRLQRKIIFTIQAAALLFLAAMALTTRHRNKVWHSENSLWKEVTIKAPGNGRGWMNYGITQMSLADYNGADSSFQKALVLLPGYSYVYINLGILKSATGQIAEAEEYFKTGLSFGATNPEAYSWYADFLIKQKRSGEARVLINKGLAISPHHEMLNGLRGRVE